MLIIMASGTAPTCQMLCQWSYGRRNRRLVLQPRRPTEQASSSSNITVNYFTIDRDTHPLNDYLQGC